MAFPLPDGSEGTVSDAAHIIQTALTPVFLLTGIGTLLGLFNTRLARVVDHLETVSDLQGRDPDTAAAAALRTHERRLRARVFALDASMVLGAIGGVGTCGSVCMLFFGSIRDAAIAGWLIGLFGVGLTCTIAALVAFLIESVLAWHGIRREGPLPKARGVTP